MLAALCALLPYFVRAYPNRIIYPPSLLPPSNAGVAAAHNVRVKVTGDGAFC